MLKWPKSDWYVYEYEDSIYAMHISNPERVVCVPRTCKHDLLKEFQFPDTEMQPLKDYLGVALSAPIPKIIPVVDTVDLDPLLAGFDDDLIP